MMKITFLDTTTSPKSLSADSSVAFGNFDGMHIGHQEVVKNCVMKAKDQNLVAVALMFSPHPRQILQPNVAYTHLCSLDEKLQHMENIGIEHAIIMSFDQALSMMSPHEFASIYLKRYMRTKRLFTGYNFHFGHMRAGDPTWLAENAALHGFTYTPIEEISLDYQSISSTNIKGLLQLGMVHVAKNLLGHHFSLKGEVIAGKKLATSILETPTANIAIDKLQALPAFGVYLVRARHMNEYLYGICNIGIKPTFEALNSALMEVHLFDVDLNLYGQNLTVEFLHFIRPERRFANLGDLKEQIIHDIRAARYARHSLNF